MQAQAYGEPDTEYIGDNPQVEASNTTFQFNSAATDNEFWQTRNAGLHRAVALAGLGAPKLAYHVSKSGETRYHNLPGIGIADDDTRRQGVYIDDGAGNLVVEHVNDENAIVFNRHNEEIKPARHFHAAEHGYGDWFVANEKWERKVVRDEGFYQKHDAKLPAYDIKVTKHHMYYDE